MLAVLCLGGFAQSSRAADRDSPRRVEEVARRLTGSFSSAEQARRDTSFFDIRLHIVPIWPGRKDGRWFYVEQAMASRPDRPYRQRVYRIGAADGGAVESAVFTLASPLRFAGAWRDRSPLAALTPDSLDTRDGCSVFLARTITGDFQGGTRGKDCASDLRGASYATSEVTLFRDRMVTLDRGFDAAGVQVWGSTKGGYEFVRDR
jgi:hypothetical protein